jgi:hypothetical protein
VSSDPIEGIGGRQQTGGEPGARKDGLHESGGSTAAYASADTQAGGVGGYQQPQPGYAGPGQGQYPPQGMYGSPGQYPPQGHYGPPQYQQQDGGGSPGFGDRASQAVTNFGRHVKTPETKEFFKTSEFGVWLFAVVAIAIAGAVIDASSHGDALRADLVWKLIAGVSAVYILSRGIAKAGTRRGYGDRPMDRP